MRRRLPVGSDPQARLLGTVNLGGSGDLINEYRSAPIQRRESKADVALAILDEVTEDGEQLSVGSAGPRSGAPRSMSLGDAGYMLGEMSPSPTPRQ